MRKESCTSDARLRSFEEELSFCKLTVASAILKGLLHVSLGAVRSWNFVVLEKKLFFVGWLCMSQKSRSFSQPKHCLFEQAILLSSNAASFRNRHRKFAPSHNLLFAKNTVYLSMSALTPYAVTPERRTDSKPFRRRFVRKTGFGSCRRKLC